MLNIRLRHFSVSYTAHQGINPQELIAQAHGQLYATCYNRAVGGVGFRPAKLRWGNPGNAVAPQVGRTSLAIPAHDTALTKVGYKADSV